MLLWINGPFGGGKTQTAYEIRRRLPGSVVRDPRKSSAAYGNAVTTSGTPPFSPTGEPS
nr:AAA family ATPase [Streptomyces roseifaciens]